MTGPNGLVDGPDMLSVLEAKDDAATANWGDDWRMPTQQDWLDLLNETTKTWDEVNGVRGLRLTGQNGNSIFLPAAGVYGGSMHSFYSNCGNLPHGEYWSNEIDSIKPYQAYILYFEDPDYPGGGGTLPNGVVGGQIQFNNSGSINVIEFIRNQGRPVRAVYVGDKK